MRATKIRMKSGCYTSMDLTEIDQIYITGCVREGFYPKGNVHDHVKANPGDIFVNIPPYPDLIPATSSRGEKYVRSTPNGTINDNLLRLPRE